MPRQIAAGGKQRRGFSAVALAVALVMAAGCATMSTGAIPSSDGAATPTPQTEAGPPTGQQRSVTARSGPASKLGWTTDVRPTTGAVVYPVRDRRLRDSRLQQRERTIGGRIGTIDRQLDILDMRRRQRRDLEPYERDRPGPREVLLKQERRGLQSERRLVQRERDLLEFGRRLDRAPPDPFTNSRRFPSRGLN